jgi:hypothetical protein
MDWKSMGRAHASRVLAALCCAALALAATGCRKSEFEQRFDEAESLRQQAAAQGYEWIATAGLLEQADELAANGDAEGALALVEQARIQSLAALEQAEREAAAWKGRVLK